MPYKKERLEKQIVKEISSIIFEDVKDERIKFVTITNVDLTNDLSIATVYYTIFGSNDQIDNTAKVFNEAKGFIRSLLARRIQVKKVPDLIFKYDNSYEQGQKIEAILKEIKEKEENK